MILPMALAQAAAHNVALVVWVTLGVLLFWESERTPTRRAAVACTLLLGLVLGLAILTKGLAGVALIGVAYGGHLLLARRLTTRACLVGTAALFLGGLAASAWYIAVELRNPNYLHYYFIDRHLMGFATGTQRHGHAPWWYYLPILVAGGSPWIAYLPVVVQDQWIKWRSRSPAEACASRVDRGSPMTLLGCWLVGGTLLLSLAHSKLTTYLWPVFPAVAILAAVVWARLWDGTLSPPARRLLGRVFWMACLVGPAVLPVMLLAAQEQLGPWRMSAGLWAATAAVAAACWIPMGFWLAGRPRATLAACVLVVAAHFVFVMTAVMPRLAGEVSARDLAAYFNGRGQLPPQLLVADERIGSLVFYLDPTLRAGLREQQLQFVRLRDIFDPRVNGAAAVVAVGEQQLVDAASDAPAQAARLADMPYERVGRYRLYRTAELTAVRQPGTPGNDERGVGQAGRVGGRSEPHHSSFADFGGARWLDPPYKLP